MRICIQKSGTDGFHKRSVPSKGEFKKKKAGGNYSDSRGV